MERTIKGRIVDLYAYLFATPFWSKLNTVLFRLGLKGLGLGNYRGFGISGERYLLKKILPALINNHRPVIFDIGAGRGSYSLELIKQFPQARIFSFEPHPKNFQALAKAAKDRFKIYNLGLGDSAGKVILYDRASTESSNKASLYKEVISEIHKQQVVSVEVNIDTLENFVKKEGLDYIDYLKIDTEGNDLAVLKGAEHLFRANKIGCVQFEFNEMNVISRVFFRDFRIFLKDYTFFRLLPKGFLRLSDSLLMTEIFTYQNILAVPNDKVNLIG